MSEGVIALSNDTTTPASRQSAPLRFLTHPATVVAAITLLGAALRFTWLSRPPLWGDEAKTFTRACGTFQQLVDNLATSDFAPLHYLLYWAIAQFTKLTPAMMRVPPAVAGTLMIPAMYWLAVQIVSRRAAMLTALFTACSAFMLNYSRDAKMYAECWLFVTLSTASLLWFLRTRWRIAWYCWMIFGVAMVGLQAVATIVLVIHAIIFLSHRSLHWKPAIYFVAGLVVILAPLVAYTKYVNKYVDRVEKTAEGPRDAQLSQGTQWVEPYNRGRDGFDLSRYAITAYLYSWEWPRPVDEPQIRERTLKLLKTCGYIFGAILLIGIFPWRNRTRDATIDPQTESWWRAMLWLSAWIVLPMYAFYCASLKSRLAPWTLIEALWSATTTRRLTSAACAIAICISFFFCDVSWTARLRKTAFVLATVAVLIGLGSIIYRYTPIQPGSVWIPRYVGIVFPAFAIAVSVMLTRLPTVQFRVIAVALLLTVNLAQHGARIVAATETPTDLMVRDVLKTQSPDADSRTYYRIVYPMAAMGEPGTGVLSSYPGRYYLSILSGKPISPDEMRSSTWERNFRVFNILPFGADALVANNVAQSPQLRRIIVWDKLNPVQVEQTDALLDRLPDPWRRVSEELHPARDHWTWRELFVTRRRVYEKIEKIPTTKPAAASPG